MNQQTNYCTEFVNPLSKTGVKTFFVDSDCSTNDFWVRIRRLGDGKYFIHEHDKPIDFNNPKGWMIPFKKPDYYVEIVGDKMTIDDDDDITIITVKFL